MLSTVYYLEDQDVTTNHTLKKYVTDDFTKPVVLMLQSTNCGHCVSAKPKYEKASQLKDEIKWCTLQMEDEQMKNSLNVWYPDMVGVPSFIGFDKKGKFKSIYDGDRSTKSLVEFSDSL